MVMKKSPSSNTLKSIQNVTVILNALLNILLGRAHRTTVLIKRVRVGLKPFIESVDVEQHSFRGKWKKIIRFVIFINMHFVSPKKLLISIMIFVQERNSPESERHCPRNCLAIPHKDMKRTPLGFSCVSECQSTRHQTGNCII